jgi:hypothetical protein
MPWSPTSKPGSPRGGNVGAALVDVLTVRALRALAGLAFARGEEYWQDGHVVAFTVDGEAIEGVVEGGERYAVRIELAGHQLVATCSCPVVADLCKHGVALGLAYLARAAEVPSPGDGVGFASRGELEAWVAANEVAYALWLPADVILNKLPAEPAQRYGMRYVLGRLALRDVAARDSASRVIGVRALEAPVVAAAHAVLVAAADDVKVGRAEEASRPARHADPVIEPLWERLLETRRAVRAHAAPRSHATRQTGTWKIDTPTGVVSWREPVRLVRPYEYGTVGIAARMTIPTGRGALLECTCAVAKGHCTHALALVDATLDLLADPARAAEARLLAEELLRPPWSRLLQELDVLEARAHKPRPVIEVWWTIERELGVLTVAPTVKKLLKRGAMSTGTRPTAARLLDEHRDTLAEVDRQIAEHVAAWTPPSRSAATARGSGYPVRAFRALIGHPRVLAEWSDDEPIEIVARSLGFTARPDGDHICLEPSLDGDRLAPDLLSDLFAMFGPGEPLVIEEPGRRRCAIVDVADDTRQLWTLLAKHGDAFPPESHDALLERLSRMEARVPLTVPSAIKGRQLAETATPVLRLRLLPDVTLELELFIRPGPGAPLYPPGAGPRDILLARNGERGYVRSPTSRRARGRRCSACRWRAPRKARRSASASPTPKRPSAWSRRCRRRPPASTSSGSMPSR